MTLVFSALSHQIKVGKTVFLCVRLLFSTHSLLMGLMWLHVTHPRFGSTGSVLWGFFWELIINDHALSETISASLNGAGVMRWKMIIKGSYALSLVAVLDKNLSHLSHHPSVCNVV